MAANGAAGGQGAKRKRVGCKKLGSVRADLEVQEAQQEEKALRERACNLLKGKSAVQLRAIIAFIEGPQASSCDQDAFPRGVKWLAGMAASRSVPHYMIKRSIARCLGLTEAEVGKWREDNQWLRRLFLVLAGKEETDEVPEPCMLLEDFIVWYVRECESVNTKQQWRKLPGVSLESSMLTGAVGCYSFVGDPGLSYFQFIRNNITGDKIYLPQACGRISKQSVPSRFVIECNWTPSEAKLSDVEEQSAWKLFQRFQKEEYLVPSEDEDVRQVGAAQLPAFDVAVLADDDASMPPSDGEGAAVPPSPPPRA